MTSQLFANVYLDAFDHFIKDELRVRHYLRYTDDMVFLHHDRGYLEGLLAPVSAWLVHHRQLSLHPAKIIFRTLAQGIDFCGYVVHPYHILLRTRTKRRMKSRLVEQNAPSYFGLLAHCDGFEFKQGLKKKLYGSSYQNSF